MITIYEAATGDAVLTFHPRCNAEVKSMVQTAVRMCERINQDLKRGAVAVRWSLNKL